MANLHIGGVFKHPEHGVVYIEDGAYQINNRVSNAWTFRKVKAGGSLDKKSLHDYGGDWPKVKAKVTHTINIKVVSP